MESPQFNTGEKTLIIQCEEGMDELDISTFNGKNVYPETVENESDLDARPSLRHGEKSISRIASSSSTTECGC